MTLRDVVKQTQWVYSFERADGSRRELLGGKGAGLADMTAASLPVPPGFIITTEACRAYYDSGKIMPAEMWAQALDSLAVLERQTGRFLGAPSDPAARLRALRRAGLHARHDGHRPQPRPEPGRR